MDNQVGPEAFIKQMQKNLPTVSEVLPNAPLLLSELYRQVRQGHLKVEWQSEEMRELRREVHQSNRHTRSTIAGGSLIVSASLVWGLNASSASSDWHFAALSLALGLAGTALMVSAWFEG